MNYMKVRMLTHDKLREAMETKKGWIYESLYQIPYYSLLGSFYIDGEEEQSDVVGVIRGEYFVDYIVEKLYRKPVIIKTDKDGYHWMSEEYLFKREETIN